MLDLLRNRGPDITGSHSKTLTSIQDDADGCDASKIVLDFHGNVLHLRGPETQQPLIDSHGNILLWNGEIFGGNFQVVRRLQYFCMSLNFITLITHFERV